MERKATSTSKAKKRTGGAARRSSASALVHQLLTPAFTDARGEIFDILEEPVSHVGLITFTKGAVRGNHYHLSSVQYSFVLNGEIELITSAVNGSEKNTTILRKGMYSRIPPQTVHTYRALSNASILDMTTLSRNDDGYEADTVRITPR